MKKILGCSIPLLILFMLGWMGWAKLTSTVVQPPHFASADTGDVEIKVTETGAIEPLKKVEIKSKVAGRIAKLYVQEGDRVQAGQLLADIDPTEVNSQVAQMRAQLDGALARLQAGRRAALYQAEQTQTNIRQTEQALKSAQARLNTAQEENTAQPGLSDAEIQQTKAALKSAQDSLVLLKNATHPQNLVVARSGFDDAKASEQTAHRNLDRMKRLLEKGFVSQQQVDTAESELASAHARLQQAQNRLELIEEQNRLEIATAQSRIDEAQAGVSRAQTSRYAVSVKQQDVQAAIAAVEQARQQLLAAKSGVRQDNIRKDEVKEAEASVTQLENQLREVEVHQNDTHLNATLAGTVTRRYIEQGELVTSGVSTFSSGTPVLQIADLSQMLVKMSVNEVDVHEVHIGLPVEITIDGVRGTKFMGHVTKVAPAAVGSSDQQPTQQASGGVIRFAVEVRVDKPDPRLMPGMSARCNIIINRKSGVVRLPVDCVKGDGADASVEIATEQVKDGKKTATYTTRKVVAGLRGDAFIEVISGIKPNEKVKPGVYNGPKRRAIEIDMH